MRLRASRTVAALSIVVGSSILVGCGGSSPKAGTERGPCLAGGTCAAGLVCASDICVRLTDADGGDAGPPASPLVVSAATRTPRTTTWSVNYWQWMPSY